MKSSSFCQTTSSWLDRTTRQDHCAASDRGVEPRLQSLEGTQRLSTPRRRVPQGADRAASVLGRAAARVRSAVAAAGVPRSYNRNRNPVDTGLEDHDGADRGQLEQIYVRPKNDAEPAVVRVATLSTVLSRNDGLSTEEPLYARRETVDALLGQAKPARFCATSWSKPAATTARGPH